MFQGSFKGVSRKCLECLNQVLSGVQGFMKDIQKDLEMVQRYFKGVSRKFQGCSEKVVRIFQGRLKGVSIEF